jgi:hypothetical protein
MRTSLLVLLLGIFYRQGRDYRRSNESLSPHLHPILGINELSVLWKNNTHSIAVRLTTKVRSKKKLND